MSTAVRFRVDDPSTGLARALVELHLERMYASSPACSVHAFDVDRLRAPDVTFWTAWMGEDLVGCGALRDLGGERAEIKAMRVADPYLGRGIGRAILEHLTAQARDRGMTSLWLETGSSPAFAPALRLYESAGFERCGPFEGYADDPFSVFMTKRI